MDTSHIPVLLEEVISEVDPQPGEVVVDGTLGNAGHSRELCTKIGKDGTLIGIDADREALVAARESFEQCDECLCDLFLVKENFRHLDEVLVEEGIGSVDIFLFDLGLRSEQLDVSGRGFTFQKDEPLYMTFRDPEELTETDTTAREIVNQWSHEHLMDLLEGYGNESHAQEIVEDIVNYRASKSIETTKQLVDIVISAVPDSDRGRKRHPATQTFQALRIAVNDEIRALQEALEKSVEFLASAGRIAVISFHSTEDRTVKQVFKTLEYSGFGKEVTATPVTPSDKELFRNPRSRSAKLRVFRRTQWEN